MGNVETYVLLSDAEGIRSPTNPTIAATNQQLRSENFPHKLGQITAAVPGLEITDQQEQVGSVSITVSVDRFHMLQLFLQEHPEVGRLSGFQATNITDEPKIFGRVGELPTMTASPVVPVSPSSVE